MAPRARRAEPDGRAPWVTRHEASDIAMGRVYALALLITVSARVAAEPLTALGPCGPVDRPYDPVELPAARLRDLKGTAVGRLGLVALRQGRVRPIPFQVDQRNGRKLALPEGPEPTRAERAGILGPDDLVVFMACDAGERMASADVEQSGGGKAPSLWREIRLEDPLDHTAGFVYLVVADAPPESPARYVAYDGRGDLVSTARYRVGMVNALPNYFALFSDGAVGPNLLDGLRLRADATLLAKLAHWTLDEQQGEHELIAWKAGPVRVVRRSLHQVRVVGIHLTAARAHSYFYPRHVFGPGSMKLPLSPGWVFRDITALGGADFRDLHGWRYHAPGTPAEGFRVDGHMDEAERAFDASGDWFLLTRGEEAIMMVTRMSENLRRGVRINLVYVDDADRRAPPEAVPGSVPLVGYRGLDVERLPADRYQFQLRIFVLSPYHAGAERRVLAQLDAPLTVDVTGEGGR